MLYLTYWKLNENMSVQERQGIAEKLTSSEMFPPEGVEILRWDGTPDNWGVLIAEAESPEAMNEAVGMWRTAGEGFFEKTVTAPAQPAEDIIAQTGKLLEAFSAE